ncbi:MAG TPA: 30S ribosomal protein S1 [Acidobacteriaceae bacterium]|jgi:small subunit ribosomal protein S1
MSDSSSNDTIPAHAYDAATAETPVPAAESAPDVAAPADEPAMPAPVDASEEESFGDIFSEFQRTQNRRSGEEGRQIRGTVVTVNAESIFVDIGYKSEGILPLTALPANREPLQPGDTLTVSVKGRDADGYYELSLFRTAQPKDWTSLEKAFAEKATIVGTVTTVVKGGLHVDVGVRAFLPASRSGARDATEMEKLVGQEIRCRITKLDVADEDVVIDRRAVTEEEALAVKDSRFGEVQEGSVLEGTVRSLADYGAFIDLGGIDGLLHVSDIAWNRIAKASDVLEVGQQVEVKVLKIDRESRRISLGMKQLQPHPWDAVPEKFKAGDRVRGTVTRTADFGAFVEIAPGVEGLVHLSEMSWSKRILKATEVLNAGDTVDAVILNINLEEKRIGLGLKQALGDPWVDAAERLTVGSVVEGPVASMTKFGAFVQVVEGVEGLVHISEITPERRLNHPSDMLRVGQVVRAQVLEVDKEKRQLRLSMKQLVPTGLDEFLAEHAAGDAVTGRVMSVANNVAQVELGEGIVAPCTLPEVAAAAPEAPAASGAVDLSAFSSMLSSKWKSGGSPAKAETKKSEEVKAGQVRSFKIAKLDSVEKRIELELVG